MLPLNGAFEYHIRAEPRLEIKGDGSNRAGRGTGSELYASHCQAARGERLAEFTGGIFDFTLLIISSVHENNRQIGARGDLNPRLSGIGIYNLELGRVKVYHCLNAGNRLRSSGVSLYCQAEGLPDSHRYSRRLQINRRIECRGIFRRCRTRGRSRSRGRGWAWSRGKGRYRRGR